MKKISGNRQFMLSEDFETTSGFSLSELHSLTSYAKKKAYCKEKLQQLGVGTSRAAFDMGGDKVLKLAINRKGIAQNEVEWDSQHYNSIIVPEIYDVDDDGYWIIMQRAEKCTASRFKQINGYTLDQAREYIIDHLDGKMNNLPQEINDIIEDESYAQEVIDLYRNYDIDWKDLIVPRNMGVVMDDNGNPMTVAIDLGANKSVVQDFYMEEDINEGAELFINKKAMAKKTILLNKKELSALIENVVLRMDGVSTKSRPIKSNINESVVRGKNIIKMKESDILTLAKNVIKNRDSKK